MYQIIKPKNILPAFFLFATVQIFAQVAGPNNPANSTQSADGCLSCPGTEWINFYGAQYDDGLYSVTNLNVAGFCFQSICYYSRALWVSDFGFSIPSTANIDGIVVDVKRSAAYLNSVMDSTVRLTYGNFFVGDNKKSLLPWDTANTYTSYGDTNDLWNYPWTSTLLNSDSFGVALKIYNITNAQQTAGVDHIRVTVYYSPAAVPVADFSADPLIVCADEGVVFSDLSINLPVSWDWTFDGGTPTTSVLQNPVISYQTPGIYDVTLIASNAIGSDTLTLPDFILVLDLPQPVISAQNDTLFCSPAETYQWFHDSTIINGAVDSFYIFQQSGTYSVLVTDSNGCSNADTIDATLPSSIYPLAQIFSIYPNPADDGLFINTSQPFNSIVIYDLVGNKIFDLTSPPSYFSVNISSWSSGIYFAVLIDDKHPYLMKLIIK